jgi:hypothetical protein
MCILEKTSYVYKENLDVYPYFCRGLVPKVNGALIVQDSGKVEVPLIMTLKKNTTPYLPDIKYVCDHLGLQFSLEDLYKMSCLYVNSSLACTNALENLGTTRKKYLCATYIISRRLSSCNNYLAQAAFKLRLPEWIKRNRRIVESLLLKFNPGNDFIAESYLKEVNESIELRSANTNKKAINKCYISVLAEQKTYISKYLITYLGAIKWFRWTPGGLLKSKMITELSVRVERNMTTDDMFMDSKMVAPELSEYVHKNSIAEAIKSQKEEKAKNILRSASDKTYKQSRTDYWNSREKKKYLSSGRGALTKLDKEALRIYNKWVNIVENGLEIEDDEDAAIISELADCPSADKHFLLGFIWEQLYSLQGSFQSEIAYAMRRQRLLLANNQGIYSYRVQLSLEVVDRYMYSRRKDCTPDILPDWLESKKYMYFNNIYYPSKSRYISDKALEEIKAGKYVDVVQMYKNNALTTKMFITASLLQKLLRKLAKRANIVVFDKHQYHADLVNDCKQQFKDLITYSHNARRFEMFAVKYVEDYIWSGMYVENASIKEEGEQVRKAIMQSRVKILEVCRAVGMPVVKTFKDNIERFSSGLGRAVEALNDMERYRMPIEDYGSRSSVIREFFENSTQVETNNTPMVQKTGINPKIRYILHDDPVTTIFINRLIDYLIKFRKYLKWTNSYYTEVRRINSKPLRQVEEILMLRYRTLWDLRETGRIFVRDDMQWGLKDITLTKEMMRDFRKFTADDYVKSLRAYRERKHDFKGQEELKRTFNVERKFTRTYQYTVAKLLGQKFFPQGDLILKSLIVRFTMDMEEYKFITELPKLDPNKITLKAFRTGPLIPSDAAPPQIMSTERFQEVEAALAANPGKGKKKKSKKQKKKDKSYEAAVSALKKD